MLVERARAGWNVDARDPRTARCEMSARRHEKAEISEMRVVFDIDEIDLVQWIMRLLVQNIKSLRPPRRPSPTATRDTHQSDRQSPQV